MIEASLLEKVSKEGINYLLTILQRTTCFRKFETKNDIKSKKKTSRTYHPFLVSLITTDFSYISIEFAHPVLTINITVDKTNKNKFQKSIRLVHANVCSCILITKADNFKKVNNDMRYCFVRPYLPFQVCWSFRFKSLFSTLMYYLRYIFYTILYYKQF